MIKEFAESTYNCMAAVCAIDGEVHDKELSVLLNFKKQWNLKTDIANPKELIRSQKDCETLFEESFAFILEAGELSNVYDLLHHCNEIADADKNLHDKEEILLTLIQKKLGKNNFFITKDHIDWNEEQKTVIESNKNERILIEAPPGAGKTELIAKKVYDLINIENVKPRNILLISFTNNAVREMQERIFHYSKNKHPLGLNISTIDSKAFSLNSSLREDYVIRGGYEKNIEDFLKILRNKSVDFLETWEDLEHIFIDEAQDLVGLRKDVCDEFIKLSNPNTGISIFGDSCQQIYPWNESGKQAPTEKEMESLIDLVSNKYTDEFKKIELKSIHRTSDDFLKSLLDNMRLSIISENDKISSQIKEIDTEDTNLLELNLGDDYLFLFRSNSEIVDAACNLNISNKIYRLKSTSNKYPNYLKSWVAKLIKYAKLNNYKTINKEDFMIFTKTISSRHLINDQEKSYIWESLKKYSICANEEISIELLLESLNKQKLPLELKNTDFGFRGPKLSTIHASKGSQAENVLINNVTKNEKISLDESKVVFVGISRAKKSLKTTNLKKKRYFQIFQDKEIKNNSYAKSKRLKRFFRLINNPKDVDSFKQKPVYIMETGLCGDYSPMSIIDQTNLSYKEAIRSQDFLSNVYLGNDNYHIYAKRENIQQREFKIYLERSDEVIKLGAFSSQVIDNIWTVGYKYLNTKKFIPPLLIDNLNLLDIGSYTINQDDIDDVDRKKYFKPFIKDEAWLYPIIYGPARFSLNFTKNNS